MIKTKLKAFLAHFILSIIIVSFIISLIIYLWFPLNYIQNTHFKDIVLLIISIDLVLGPVLTFIVFKPQKKNLRFDLTIIAALQFSALGYGSYNLYKAHPVYLTFAKGSFSLVNAQFAKPENAKYSEYNISKLATVKLAYAEIPKNASKFNALLDESMSGGPDLDERADLYKPYKNHIDDIIKASLNPKKIFSDKETKEKVNNFLKKHKDKLQSYAYLPLEGQSKDAIIVIDKKSAKPVTSLQIDPWKYVKK